MTNDYLWSVVKLADEELAAARRREEALDDDLASARAHTARLGRYAKALREAASQYVDLPTSGPAGGGADGE